jgi:hypothetical protein
MERKRVVSSNIASIGYEPTRPILEVEFLNGSIYQYFGVPQHLYLGLMNASSHGEYLDAYIKKGGFRYLKVR